MMKKAIPFCLSAALLTSTLTAYAAVDTNIFRVENHFSVSIITLSNSLSNSFVYDQAFIELPEFFAEVALGFTNGGATIEPFAATRGLSGGIHQPLKFGVWDASYQQAANPFYQPYMTHTPAVMSSTGRQDGFLAELALAHLQREKIWIHTNPTIEWSTADGYVKTAPQTGNHTVGALASMTRASENTNVIQTNLLRTVAWIAEKGTSISPPRILKCIPNAETAKPDCTDTALDLSLFSEIQSVMFRPHSNVVYVTAVDAATGTSGLYYVRVDVNTGLPSSPSLGKVIFSDGFDHQLNWVFSAPGDTDVFYAASSSRMYQVWVDSRNPDTATIRDIDLTGLSADPITVPPQIFTQPTVWQQRAGLGEERDAKRLKTEHRREFDHVVIVGQGDTVSMCGGMDTSSKASCWPGAGFGADITAISAPTSFNWELDVQGAQIRPAVDLMVGFETPVSGYDTTLLGCSILFPQKMDDHIIIRCEAAAAESEGVTALARF